MYHKHYDKPSKADSREMEDISVTYEGYEEGYVPSTVPEANDIKDYNIYME